MPQLSWPRLLALASFSFAVTLVSNTLDPAVLGHKVLQLSPEKPNTLLGFSTFAGSLIAIFVGPIVGAYSDRSQRRLPYFFVGVPLSILALYLIALAPSISLFVVGVLLFRIGDNFIFTAWQALYPDYVNRSQRGLGAGIKSLVDIVAVLIGRFAAGELVARAPDWGELAVLAAVSVPVLGLLLALGLTLWSVRGLRRVPQQDSLPKHASWRDFFKIDWRSHPTFLWWFINRILFWTGFTILGTFLLFFVIDVVGLVEADAQRYLARLSLVLGGGVLLAALPAGRLADRIGRKPLVIFACGLTALGTLLVLLIRDLTWFTAAGGLIGLGSGIYISASFALLTDSVPAAEAGRFMGFSNIAGAGGGAIARLLGGLLIDPINAISASSQNGYLLLYALAAVLFFLSTLAALRLPAPIIIQGNQAKF